jgi:hypothetical protein
MGDSLHPCTTECREGDVGTVVQPTFLIRTASTIDFDIDTGTLVLVHQPPPDRAAAPGGAPRSQLRSEGPPVARADHIGRPGASWSTERQPGPIQGGIRHRRSDCICRLSRLHACVSTCASDHQQPVPETGWKPPCPEHGGFHLSHARCPRSLSAQQQGRCQWVKGRDAFPGDWTSRS